MLRALGGLAEQMLSSAQFKQQGAVAEASMSIDTKEIDIDNV